MIYRIRVAFDDDTSSRGDADTYYGVLGKWRAMGRSNSINQSSVIAVNLASPSDIESLVKDLRGIEVLEIEEAA